MTSPNSHHNLSISHSGAPVVLSRRRLMGHLVLGSAAALVLSACGGGSDNSDSDSNSGQEAKLIYAYEHLEKGMDWTDVEALVGFSANDVRDPSLLRWVVGSVILRVQFRTGNLLIASGLLKIGSNPSTEKTWEV